MVEVKSVSFDLRNLCQVKNSLCILQFNSHSSSIYILLQKKNMKDDKIAFDHFLTSDNVQYDEFLSHQYFHTSSQPYIIIYLDSLIWRWNLIISVFFL